MIGNQRLFSDEVIAMANEIWALAVIAMAISRWRANQQYGTMFTGMDFQTLLQAAGLVMVGGAIMDQRNPLEDITNTFKRRRLN